MLINSLEIRDRSNLFVDKEIGYNEFSVSAVIGLLRRVSRARGLKHPCRTVAKQVESRPTRARGLKRFRILSPWTENLRVAPYTGAWIETLDLSDTTSGSLVAPYTGAWIETSLVLECLRRGSRRALHGRVD